LRFTLLICCFIIMPMHIVSENNLPDSDDSLFVKQRLRMVEKQIVRRGIEDKQVLEAMRSVPRHRFVPQRFKKNAYDDEPLPIGNDQTISQPYVVALMTELLGLNRESKVLEIGTGSGYQAAVLAELCDSVSSIEIICNLAEQADSVLMALGYNVDIKCGNGYRGWPEKAPFDAIIVTAAPDEIPEQLIDQLADGGRLVIPVGRYSQSLKLILKTENKVTGTDIIPVRFVPMTGEAEAD